MNQSVTKATAVWTVFFILFLISKSYAHFLWLDVDDYTPQKNQEILVTFGWGHTFSKSTEPFREEMVNNLKVFMIDPDGLKTNLKISLKKNQPQPLKIRVTKKGVYLLVATAKYFASKTTEGFLFKSRDELRNKEVLYSKWYENTAISLISVGRQKEISVTSIPESNFYMLPFVNPSTLKKGDIFQVKVLLKGKPYRTWVYATYTGFSELKDTFAWATRTDKNGIASIKILKKNVDWLIKTEIETQYPDPQKADLAVYRCTITFGF